MSELSTFTVLIDEPIATINPLLHGQFAEHLGELIYPGIYVGEGSSIPNTNGIRSDVVEALCPLDISVLRWPGGCYADTYHWRDGIGPKESRKKRVNLHWGMADESNHFGTHEFMAFCRAIGAEPYFAANLGSAPPSETQEWIEYCNFAGQSALADERRANGAGEPFRVPYWGIGNENWGCGGNMTPEQYAGEYNRYQTFAFSYPGAPITKVACGPNSADWNWTRQFFATILNSPHKIRTLGGLNAFAAHYYSGTAGNATEYTEAQWLELLAKGSAVEGIITGHRSIMDEFDPERKIKLYLDEWGTWHPVEKGKPGGGLYQQNSIRDACLAAITLDIFNNHADKVEMANIAQLINVLQSLLLVEEDRCIKTPTFHAFDLYKSHKGATALRTESASPTIIHHEHCNHAYIDGRFPGLRQVQGSASINGKSLVITLVNSHPANPAEVNLTIDGASIASTTVTTLATPDIHDHNTFEEPDKVTISPAVALSGNRAVLAPASVNRFDIQLG